MKIKFGKAVVTLFISVFCSLAWADDSEYIPNEVLVKFKGQLAANTYHSTNANRAIGAKSLEQLSQLGVTRIRVPDGMSFEDARAYYKGLPAVEYIERNPRRYQSYIPNDRLFQQQYALAKIRCHEAWNLSKGSSDVVIAVIDDGIVKNHEDLESKRVPGYDFTQGDRDPTTSQSHGTHVSGIIAAATNNSKGGSGVAFNCRIMPLRIFPNGAGAASAQAILFAADNGAKVINMSYGGYPQSLTEQNAVNYAWNKGVVLVAASGNSGTTKLNYPAAYPNVIAVGSTGRNDARSGYSNYGENWVSVGAPGEGVLSTVRNGYGEMSGTSMASPMVAGLAGLLWSFAPEGTTASEIREAIESTTDPISNGGFAHGRVNAMRALSVFNTKPVLLSNPIAIQPWFGNGFQGGVQEILNSDEAFVRANSERTSGLELVGVTVDIEYQGHSTNSQYINLLLEAAGPPGSTGQVYLWDGDTGSYQLHRNYGITASPRLRHTIALPIDARRFIVSNKIKVGLRILLPYRPFGRRQIPYEGVFGFVQIQSR